MATKNKKVARKKATEKPTDNSHKRDSAKADHLKPYWWQKGCPSPNPGGRPKDYAAIFARMVIEGMTDEEIVQAVRGMRGKLKAGDSRVFVAISERGYGKMAQGVNLAGPDGQPLVPPTINVAFKSAPQQIDAPKTEPDATESK
jgi:hypothetical protein